MEKMELLPTEENVIKTIMEDKLNRNDKLRYLYKFLVDNKDINTISINGDWGSGKTFFVKQLKYLVECIDFYPNNRDKIKNEIVEKIMEKNDRVYKEFRIVYYDAWENDDVYDPLLSLVYSIGSEMADIPNLGDKKKIVLEATEGMIDFIDGCLTITGGLIVGKGIKGLYKFLVSLYKSMQISGYERIKESKMIKDKINEWFDKLGVNSNRRIIIVIDELDRCKPDFAIQLLERIKHYFSHPNITFIFTTNMRELSNSVKRFYGSDFDAGRYLDRFFDIKITLLSSIGDNLINKNVYMDNRELVSVKILSILYNMTPRETAKLGDQFMLAREKANRFHSDFQGDGRLIKFSLGYIVPIILANRILGRTEEMDFINGKNSKYLFEFAEFGDNKLCIRNELEFFKPLYDIEDDDEFIQSVYDYFFNPKIDDIWDKERNMLKEKIIDMTNGLSKYCFDK